MIHYTLLPENEMKSLRHEYRIRLIILALFFICSIVVVGILILIPSYVISDVQEKGALNRVKELKSSQEASGVAEIEKNLALVENITKRIIANDNNISYSSLIEDVISHKTKEVKINSFSVSKATGTSTPVEIIVQGKASTRDSLVIFKNNIESDKQFSKVELPVSDLAKSKDIGFALRLTVKKQ
ncbi:MAG TPA: hypothetical protein VJC02_01545 [Candidatus Paceibacterota bacterium]